MTDKIIFYDIRTKDPIHCWSYNPWKVRLTLNYKQVDYETHWLEYPEIAPTLKPTGLIPNESPLPPYTCPAVKLSSGEMLMDSLPIIKALEAQYPSPSLNLDYEHSEDVLKHYQDLLSNTRNEWLPYVPDILNEPSVPYFHGKFEKLHKTADQLKAEGMIPENWEKAKTAIQALAKYLKKSTGPFLTGNEPSAYDFHIAGSLNFLQEVNKPLYARVISVDSSLEALFEACTPWFERNSY